MAANPEGEKAELERLALDAAGGDAGALDRLLEAIGPLCLDRCRRILANPLDAEEAAQDALLTVARRIGTFEGRSQFTTWLYRVTSNAAVDTYRRVKRRSSVLGVDVSETAGPERTSLIAGTRLDLLDALAGLDRRVAEPVVLRDLCGLDYGEIALALDIPAGTVKSRIHEARQTLQRLMTG